MIIFSDIDGTLAHKTTKGHGLVQIPTEPRYVSSEAISLIERIRDTNKFVIITGRRKSGFERLASIIPYDKAIIEHGCLVLEGKAPDAGWQKHLAEAVDELWRYESKLLAQGYKTDSNGRTASFRVFKDTPENLTETEKESIEKKLRMKSTT